MPTAENFKRKDLESVAPTRNKDLQQYRFSKNIAVTFGYTEGGGPIVLWGAGKAEKRTSTVSGGSLVGGGDGVKTFIHSEKNEKSSPPLGELGVNEKKTMKRNGGAIGRGRPKKKERPDGGGDINHNDEGRPPNRASQPNTQGKKRIPGKSSQRDKPKQQKPTSS